jgi:multidrug efflux pump subunit AcrA (membrane-fusion protein)
MKLRRVGLWLFLGFGWLLIVSSAFILGHQLAAYDAQRLIAQVQALQAERDALTAQLSEEREQLKVLGRAMSIDREALRSAQSELALLESARIQAERRSAQLAAMVSATGRGLVEVRALSLRREAGGEFVYRVLLEQLLPDIDITGGEAVLSLLTREAGGTTLTPISDLSTEDAGRHTVAFEHAEVLEGRFRLPTGVEPIDVVVEILPKGDTFIGVKRSFAWADALSASDDDTALSVRRLGMESIGQPE